MKNIHLVPTDKPSRFSLNSSGKYHLTNQLHTNSPNFTNQNIYITSNEEIKEGFFYLHISNDINGIEYITINICYKPHRKKDDEWYVDGMYANQCKKIIFTDNQDLIKDGVQEISDEFLEWFVKNPSCEFIKTKLVNFEIDMGLGDSCIEYGSYYEIIFPKEEIKQDILPLYNSKTKTYAYWNGSAWEDKSISGAYFYSVEKANNNGYFEKHEILEGVVAYQQELFSYLHDLGVIALQSEMHEIERIVLSMQQEQDKNKYSQEEVYQLTLESLDLGMKIRQAQLNGFFEKSGKELHKQWFEQFKKKKD